MDRLPVADGHLDARHEPALPRLQSRSQCQYLATTPTAATIHSHLQAKGWRVEREHLLVNGFPVQFLAAAGLTEEAVREARAITYEGVPAKVFRPEHIVAIAASEGRHKDLARIEQMLEQAEIDRTLLDEILRWHKLTLPKP